jgi:hypothetical protein
MSVAMGLTAMAIIFPGLGDCAPSRAPMPEEGSDDAR